MTLAQQLVWMELLLERTETIPPLEKDKIKERLSMFDKLFDESPMVQKRLEQISERMRKQMSEQFRAQYYEEGINKGMAQGMAQGINQGEVQALQRTLVNVVQVRFPDLTEFVQKQIKLYSEPAALELLFQKMLTAPDAKTAQWLLESKPEQ